MKDILIVAATKMELPPIDGAVRTGFGKEKTKKAMFKLLKTQRPRLVVSVGLVGAVVPELKVGDIFIPEILIDYENKDKRYYLDSPMEKYGVLVTVPKVFERDDKYELKRIIPDATCVDMETSTIAGILEPLKIPLICIKAVSDELDFDFNDKRALAENIKKAVASQNEYLCRVLRQML